MGRAIKVDDQVYNELEKMKQGRQTFSDIIEALLATRLKALELFSVLEGQIKFRKWQNEQREKERNED